MITGECRVDTIPFGASPGTPGARRLAIDGLRLRLDLRIVPGEAGSGDAAAKALWRIEDARVATLPLGIPVRFRWLAVAAGLGALLLALGVWFAGGGSSPTPGSESTGLSFSDRPPESTPASALASSGSPSRGSATRGTPASAAHRAPHPAPSAAGSSAVEESSLAGGAAPRSHHGAEPGDGATGARAGAAGGATWPGPSSAGAPEPAAGAGVAPRIALVPDAVASAAAEEAAREAAERAVTEREALEREALEREALERAAVEGEAAERARQTAERAASERTPGALPPRAPAVAPRRGGRGTPAAPRRATAEEAPRAAGTPASPRLESVRDDRLDLFGDPK